MSLFSVQLAQKGRSIKLQTRRLSTRLGGSESATFSTVAGGDVLAIVCTPKGKTVFDGVNTEEDVTHTFHLAHPGFEVTRDHWVLLGTKRYRVLRATNCCEADERWLLECTERGATDRVAANA